MENTITIKAETFEKARKTIRENKGKTIIFTSSDDDLNRKVMEKETIDVLLIPLSKRKDYGKQRNSGFNQVLAKIAKKKAVSIGIDIDEILKTNPKEKAEVLSRIRQNIKLCNKNKLKMVFVPKDKKKPQELKALGLVLGMPTNMIKWT